MDAIVTAGGIPKTDEPLYPYTQGASKALLDISGKPMIQWVLDALQASNTVDRIVIIGLPPDTRLPCEKIAAYIPNQGSMIENIRSGVRKIVELNSHAEHVLVVSSDIPGIDGAMVDWLVQTCLQTNDDIYYSVIQRQVMEARYPTSKRTFTQLKDIEVCGGDMHMIKVSVGLSQDPIWDELIGARKTPLKQALIIGLPTLIMLLLHMLKIDDAVHRVTRRIRLSGRAIISPYAEIGMDIDKPHQLEMMRQDFASRGTPA